MIRLPLTRGAVALIDDADLPLVQGYNWFQTANGYAARSTTRSGKRFTILMHRLISDVAPTFEVDHANGDTLDNRRANLRVCTRHDNARNRKLNVNKTRSRFKGVRRPQASFSWIAAIRVDGVQHYLGSFMTELDAAFAYDRAAVEHFGRFARLNFPQLQASSVA